MCTDEPEAYTNLSWTELPVCGTICMQSHTYRPTASGEKPRMQGHEFTAKQQ